MAAGAVGAAGAESDFGAAQPGSAGAAHDGSVFAAHDGSAGAAQPHDGSEELAHVEQEPDSQLEQELQLELDSQLEQDDLQHMCLNKPPKWKQPPPQPPQQALACDSRPATAKQAAATTNIKTRFMEASSKQC